MSDLINRQDAIDALSVLDISDGMGISCIASGVQYSAIRAIEDLPSAEPEGAEILVGQSSGGTTMWYECDKCHTPVDVGDKYCRKCGRRFVHE